MPDDQPYLTMEQTIGEVVISDSMKIVVRTGIDRDGNKVVDTRLHVTTGNYTGFTKKGTWLHLPTQKEVMALLVKAVDQLEKL